MNSDIDLVIDNYDLDDLLNLFKLDHDFTRDDMRIAKKIVMRTHPDKSGMDKKYFLFFSSAYMSFGIGRTKTDQPSIVWRMMKKRRR
jgi:hypothetical protein